MNKRIFRFFLTGVIITGTALTMQTDLGTINATNMKRAHTRVESAKTMGKIVLSGF
jgi:hypothetical protein